MFCIYNCGKWEDQYTNTGWPVIRNCFNFGCGFGDMINFGGLEFESVMYDIHKNCLQTVLKDIIYLIFSRELFKQTATKTWANEWWVIYWWILEPTTWDVHSYKSKQAKSNSFQTDQNFRSVIIFFVYTVLSSNYPD